MAIVNDVDFGSNTPLVHLKEINDRYGFVASIVREVGPSGWPTIKIEGKREDIEEYLEGEYGDDDGHIRSLITD